MKRALVVMTIACLAVLMALGAVAALGIRHAAADPSSEALEARLDEAGRLLATRYASAGSPGEKAFLEDVAEAVDGARANAAGSGFARESGAGGLFAFVALATMLSTAALAALWLFALNMIAAPLERLSATMRADPESVRALSPERRGIAEVRALYESFDSLVGKLGSYRDRARAAERETYGRFVVHEVKNALTPIPLALNVLASSAPADPESAPRKAARLISDQLEALESLLERFRQSYRFPEPRLAPCDLGLLAARSPYIRDGRASLSIAPRADTPKAEPRQYIAPADSRLVAQALDNLILNALEACAGAPGAKVAVRLHGEAQAVVIDVEDTGPGIDDTTRARLFSEWFTTKPKGMGLGLTLTRRVAEAHGGSLECRSYPGVSTIFSLRIPQESS